MDDDVEVDTIRLPLRADDASALQRRPERDARRREIREILAEHPDPEAAATALVEAAVEAGGIDNVTVVVIRVESDAADSGEPGLPPIPGAAEVNPPSSAGACDAVAELATLIGDRPTGLAPAADAADRPPEKAVNPAGDGAAAGQ